MIHIDEALQREASAVLDGIGLDVETVVRMTLKRIIRDGGISFLIANSPRVEAAQQVAAREHTPDRITKNAAIARFREAGIPISKNVTFASSNRASGNYWANPVFAVLQEDWYLILHDWQNRELSLFFIPANQIHAQQMVCRNDQSDKIDLQIYYDDVTFTDSRSKISFSGFFVKKLSY